MNTRTISNPVLSSVHQGITTLVPTQERKHTLMVNSSSQPGAGDTALILEMRKNGVKMRKPLALLTWDGDSLGTRWCMLYWRLFKSLFKHQFYGLYNAVASHGLTNSCFRCVQKHEPFGQGWKQYRTCQGKAEVSSSLVSYTMCLASLLNPPLGFFHSASYGLN